MNATANYSAEYAKALAKNDLAIELYNEARKLYGVDAISTAEFVAAAADYSAAMATFDAAYAAEQDRAFSCTDAEFEAGMDAEAAKLGPVQRGLF